MYYACGVLVVTLMVCVLAGPVWAVQPTVDERATARQWADIAFGGAQTPLPLSPGIEIVTNYDPVQKKARFGKPLKVNELTYTRGLFCHANSKIIVRLPEKGATFAAIAGADNNEQTSGGRGSVIFSVSVDGKQAFKSDVLHGGDLGVQVKVDLAGAREFIIEVSDAGDGISCDQADWADARVYLESGEVIWLDDLPMASGPVLLEPGAAPFSFTYGGKASHDFLASWKVERATRKLDDLRTEYTVDYTDPDTGLAVRCVGIAYGDFPTVEWTLYFKNTGAADTPIIEGIRALDIGMQRGDRTEFTLHHFTGSECKATDYGPNASPLAANSNTRFAAAGGRPSNGVMPYFNIESSCGDGLIAVVGWPGQWAAEFVRDAAKGLRIWAGQELTHFTLHPGEEIRTPMIVLQFWQGDWVRAQNVWRRWMMAYGMPKPGGKLPPPMTLGCSSRAYEEMIKADDQKQIMFIDRYLEEKIKIDYWWMDAGWYIQKSGWPQVGTWEVDPVRFPNGFKPISDHAHANGIKILVWFEPERVAAGTWITENHPEWVFGGAAGGLLNLGNPDAWNWLTNHIDKLLTDQGIDLYRQDFNMDPLELWRKNDTEDRQGITEIKHVTGYLAYWDELRRRHPDMLIDSCASGGRRNDLETMRRAVPLWRSDYAFEPIGHQCMTYGISFWLPFHGTGTVASVDAPYYGGGLTPVDPYAFWSNTCPSINCGFDMRVHEIDYAALRALFAEWRQMAPNYYGDYYPLTPYTTDPGAWIGWQFDRPEEGQGVIQIFRRAQSNYLSAAFPLNGLDPEANYEINQLGTDTKQTLSGKELMENGLVIALTNKPSAAAITYKIVQGK